MKQMKNFKVTGNEYLDIYVFLKEHTGEQFTKKELIKMSKYCETPVDTALKNLAVRRLIIKDRDNAGSRVTWLYHHSKICDNMED